MQDETADRKWVGELEKMERAIEFSLEDLLENNAITQEQFESVDKFEVITELAKAMIWEAYMHDDLTDPESDALDILLDLIEKKP